MFFLSYKDAKSSLPPQAYWSSSFGNPGDMGGYQEFWRMKDGKCWEISNGTWPVFEPATWSVREATPIR